MVFNMLGFIPNNIHMFDFFRSNFLLVLLHSIHYSFSGILKFRTHSSLMSYMSHNTMFTLYIFFCNNVLLSLTYE